MGKRGPKAKVGTREANGRLSRKPDAAMDRFVLALDKSERDVLDIGLEARRRVHGIAPAETKNQMAGSFVGRLCLSGEITRAQYHAALTFEEDWRNNSLATEGPRQPGAVNLNATRGGIDAYEDVTRTRHLTERWRLACAAVQTRQNELRGAGALYASLQLTVLQDITLPHLVGSLRQALNALVRHYRIDSSVDA